MYEKTMECADMIMASHGPLWQNTFALCNSVLGQRENYVFFYLIRQNIPSRSLSHTHMQDNSARAWPMSSGRAHTNKWRHTNPATKISFDRSFNLPDQYLQSHANEAPQSMGGWVRLNGRAQATNQRATLC